MGDETLPALGPGVDLTKMAPLNQRRSVTFLNHYVCHTTNFLNKFSNMAEDRLSQQQLEMQRIEIALNILEAKLASIPGLDDINKETPSSAQEPAPQQESVPTQSTENLSENSAEPVQTEPIPNDPNIVTVKNDARYAKYIKMVAVGVPKMAVEGKMRAEGLDPDLLDNPDAPVPDGGQAEESDNESQSLSSGDDFSD